MNDNIDIDKLLVVTFTNAAASEMRERVLDAIYKKLDENPDDENLQKQIILLGKSNICTIHSFCLDVIKNNFFEIDLPASFRIASGEEIELLKQEVLDDVFEELYESENEEFSKLIESYTGYRGDEKVQDLVLNIYRIAQSTPFPQKWLNDKVEMFNKENSLNEDFSKSIWGEILLNDLKDELVDAINNLKILQIKLNRFDEMEKFSITVKDDIFQLEQLQNSCDLWDNAFEFASKLKFKTWPTDKKANPILKEEAKKTRDSVKKKINNAIDKILLYNSEDAFKDIFLLYDNLKAIQNVVLKFSDEFQKRKRNKNMIDFSDIEHYALQILVKEENGEYIPTDVAKRYQNKFEEIAIDEYQDSNQIQEFILKSVSRGNNIFMVGDVKQSIYKFRQACPELFLDKYENYSLEGNEKGLKIQLFKNFRSNKNILDITNIIFENIMSKYLGDIDYTEEEFLNLGADYPEIENGVGKSELHIIDVSNEKEDITWSDDEEDDDNGVEEQLKNLSNIELEAKFVCSKIKELVKANKKVKCKDNTYKNLEYRDIVILLRSTSSSAPIFERELVKNNIPVFSDSSSEYLETMEVQTILNILKMLDNPVDDINLVSVLRSPIGNFSDNEILEIRLQDRDDRVYNNLINFEKLDNKELKLKVEKFLANINTWKAQSQTISLAELIWQIYSETGFLNYVGLMPNGILRQANLRILFERAKDYEKTSFSGLFNFIKFTEKLRLGSSDMSSAKVIGENENVVRIMSIHKSKGLEFPVVFLSCANKQINLQDLKTDILLHKDIGFGPEYIDYLRKIRYPTASKQAIKIVGKNETISEEMRILYVALTRAKEKLIITGTYNNVQKEIEKKKDILNIYGKESEKINPIILKKYTTYLDWIYLVYLTGKLNDSLDFFVHDKKELVCEEEQIEESKKSFDFEEKIDDLKFDKIFDWQYSNISKINTPLKTTVSQIKQLKMGENFKNKIGLEEIKLVLSKSSNQITASRKGTLMHLALQKIDFSQNYTIEQLQNFVNKLVLNKFINEQEAQNININKIEKFLNSEIGLRIKNAKEIRREEAFCINMELEEYDNQEVIVQGIIDLYFIDENDKLVLLDYKTDFAEDENVLKNKYKIQLEIYKKALEGSLNRKVDEVYIYSIYMDKLIELREEK